MISISRVLVQRRDDGSLCAESRAVYHQCLMDRLPAIAFDGDAFLAGEIDHAASDLVVGSVEVVACALERLGVPVPTPDYYPAALRRHLHRRVWRSNAAEVERIVAQGGAVFAKSEDWKRYTGRVVDYGEGMAELGALPPDTPMWLSDPVCWLSEERIYVVQDSIVGQGGYNGDEDVPLDMEVVRQAVEAFAAVPGRPAAYAFDWGVLESGETALVEMNDGWAIGFYSGVSRSAYYRMLAVRWEQMMQTKR